MEVSSCLTVVKKNIPVFLQLPLKELYAFLADTESHGHN